jgi:hypothetical protein
LTHAFAIAVTEHNNILCINPFYSQYSGNVLIEIRFSLPPRSKLVVILGMLFIIILQAGHITATEFSMHIK